MGYQASSFKEAQIHAGPTTLADQGLPGSSDLRRVSIAIYQEYSLLSHLRRPQSSSRFRVQRSSSRNRGKSLDSVRELDVSIPRRIIVKGDLARSLHILPQNSDNRPSVPLMEHPELFHSYILRLLRLSLWMGVQDNVSYEILFHYIFILPIYSSRSTPSNCRCWHPRIQTANTTIVIEQSEYASYHICDSRCSP
ncbi:hypothetical protein M422DRAFT_253017 [Sphaerobolus stellatus SS14]|uniref:Uncharacterized protein n=1 Tax=Sphaerobolus stellatus (strain SS14) TaxID=990650 RepID=A0A0C9V9W4_SPHS4|nr:hypothetical protein M422DRAFT_253017 [Sphaerobolus stellatus SS14]